MVADFVVITSFDHLTFVEGFFKRRKPCIAIDSEAHAREVDLGRQGQKSFVKLRATDNEEFASVVRRRDRHRIAPDADALRRGRAGDDPVLSTG